MKGPEHIHEISWLPEFAIEILTNCYFLKQKEYQGYIAVRDQSLFIARMGAEGKMTGQKNFLPHHFPSNLNSLDE